MSESEEGLETQCGFMAGESDGFLSLGGVIVCAILSL